MPIPIPRCLKDNQFQDAGNLKKYFISFLPKHFVSIFDNIIHLNRNRSTMVNFSITDGMVQAECTIAAYLFQTISTNSTWLLVVMTADKCISIVNPLSKHQPRWRPVEYTPCIIGSVFATSVFCNIPYIFSAKVSVSVDRYL